MNTYGEYALPKVQSLRCYMRWLKQQRLRCDFVRLREHRLASCVLRGANGEVESAGIASGPRAESQALAQALRHWLMDNQWLTVASKMQSWQEWCQSQHAHQACRFRALPSFLNQTTLVKFWQYRSLYTHRDYWLPEPLMNAHRRAMEEGADIHKVLRLYACPVGWAVGNSRHEAVVQAVNDVVAHHYLGEIYKALMGLTTLSLSLRRVPIGESLEYVDGQSLAGVTLYIAKTRFGSYFCLALARGKPRYVLRAVAASYSRCEALQQALRRVLNQRLLLNSETQCRLVHLAGYFENFHFLAPLIDLAPLESSPLMHGAYLPEPEWTLSKHYQRLHIGMLQGGGDVLLCEMLSNASLHLVSVYIPDVDFFHLLGEGQPVMPLPSEHDE